MNAPRLRLLFAALALSSTALSSTAYAGDVEKGEHTRISEEMRKLAARNAWPAVEASFKRLEELEKKGEVISYKEFMLGAESARALGDMTSSRARVLRASKIDPTKESLDWLADVDANFGRTEISFDGRYQGARTLVPSIPPFAPDQRAAIAFAAAEIAAGKGYTGLLPAGEYMVGETKIMVTTGEKIAVARLGAPAAGGPKDPKDKTGYVGPRAQLGVAFTSAGEPGEGAEGLQPGPFAGAGARVGVGVEVGLSKTFGVIAEVGYHSLFADAPADLPETTSYKVEGSNLHLGYGWLAANLRFGNLWLAAGPVWSVGGGAALGADDGCTTCAEGSDQYTRFNGDVMMGGGAASISYALVDLGSLKGALTVEGGAQSDFTRMYPWGQVAFSVAPSGSRRKK